MAGAPERKLLAAPARRAAFIAELQRQITRGRFDADPAIATLLDEEGERIERELELRAKVRALGKSLGTLSRALYPYQREGVEQFFHTGRLLLADDMGLGKTTQAIAICHALYDTRTIARGVLVVPAALKGQWKREWDATTTVPSIVVEGSPSDRERIYADTGRGFLLIGYEQLLRDLAHVQAFTPELVVLDEAQRIKNWATKSAAYVKSLGAPHRLVLTGTPMENRFDELASIMDFVDDTALEPKWRLAPWHAVQTGDGGRGSGGARNLEDLRARLSGRMLRRVRREVLEQLPARTDTRVPVEMTEAQRVEHQAFDHPIAVLVHKMQRRALTQPEFLRLMQMLTTQRIICNGLAQLRFSEHGPRLPAAGPSATGLDELSAPKLSAFRGLVEQVVIGQRRKVVVFSQWRAMLRLAHWSVRDLLAAAGMKAVFFTGAESSRQREQAIVELHDDEGTTVMFLSDAGGVGLNLQRAATCCINLELPWNPAVLEQRIGRIYRIGQLHPIDVYNLVCEEGIEARIAELVAHKQAVFSSLFDGTSDEVRFDGSTTFLEGVRRLVEPLPPVPEAVVEAEDVAEGPATTPDAGMPEPPDVLGENDPSPRPAQAASGLRVERLEDGRLRIEAPASLAEPLAALLEQLAAALRDR
ncbi:MAG: DEAD/DEAH box helicase [Deltaproteobacteria bacterium]|nr:DEAD/DEAH box helicase [Nannocystaceae bacterium]